MIKLIVDNQEVYLDPKTSIRFDLVYPAFETEYLHASMVYPFDIPAFKNEAIFSHSNHIVVNKKYRIYDCEFSFANAINFNGKLVLSKLSRTSFRGSIILNGFSVDSKDILLKDFTYDDDVTLGATAAAVATYIEGVVANSYPTTNFNFPFIEAPLWYGSDDEHNTDYGNYLNAWSKQTQSILVNSIKEDPFPDSNNSILPCLYLMYVIKSCFADLGFKISGDFLTHSELSQLIIFNNSPLDLIENKYTVKAIERNDQTISSLTPQLLKFSDDFTPPYQDNDDRWDTSTRQYTIAKEGYHDFIIQGNYNASGSAMYTHFLSIKVRDLTDSETLYDFYVEAIMMAQDIPFIFEAIKIWIPLGKVGNIIVFTARAWHYEDQQLTPTTTVFSDMLLDIKNTSFCLLNSFKKTLHYADHLPEISFGNLISAISQAFGLFILFDHQNRNVEIEFLQSLIDNPNAIDLTNKYIDGSHVILLKESQGYSYQFKWDGSDFDEEKYFTDFNTDNFIGEFDSVQDLYIPAELNVFAFIRNINAIYYYHIIEETGASRWDLYSYYFPPFISTPAKSDIQIPLSPLMLIYDSNDDSIYPYTLIKCSSPSFATGIQKCDLHLLFYRGLGSEDDAYPFATPFALDRYGSQEWNNELRIDGDNGLMKNFLSGWLEFIKNSQEVSMDFDLNLEYLRKIMQLFLPQKGTKIRKILVNNTEYIPKKFSIMLTMNGIQSCQGKLIKKGMIEV